MDDTIGKAAAGLMVAAVSALTFVAYKHPRAYSRMSVWVTLLGIILVVAISSWNSSNQFLRDAIISSDLIQGKFLELNTIALNSNVPLWWLIIALSIQFYNLFLLSFPHWLLEPEPQKKRDD